MPLLAATADPKAAAACNRNVIACFAGRAGLDRRAHSIAAAFVRVEARLAARVIVGEKPQAVAHLLS